MKTRTKWFLGILVAVAAIASFVDGGNGSGLIKVAMLAGLVWLFWRAFVFISLLFKPIRQKIAPQVTAFNDHLDDTLHRSGLGAVSDAGNKVQSGIHGAVNATQKGIDERNGKLHEPVFSSEPTPETHVRCPDCRELVRSDARICRFCRCVLVPQ